MKIAIVVYDDSDTVIHESAVFDSSRYKVGTKKATLAVPEKLGKSGWTLESFVVKKTD